MRIIHNKPVYRVELIPENRTEQRYLDEQFGPWELSPDETGLRGPAGENFEVMLCRREADGAVLIEMARAPEGAEE